jgi:transposase-like protein
MRQTSRKPKRSYSNQQKAEALAIIDSARSISEAARISSIPEQTLNGWANGKHVSRGIQELREQKRENLADAFEDIAWRALGELKDRGIDQARPGELNAIAGTAIDKMRLLRENRQRSSPKRGRSSSALSLMWLRSTASPKMKYVQI